MAESYFDLLTEQSGIPAKPFDPVGELKRLRQRLTLRMQVSEPPEIEIPAVVSPSMGKPTDSDTLETVVKTVRQLKKTLTTRQRSRFRRRLLHPVFVPRKQSLDTPRHIPEVVTQYLTDPQADTLEIMSAGLTAFGIMGIIFSALSFYRGWEGDFSLGSLLCFSGLTIMTIGLAGRFLASRTIPLRHS